MLSRKPLDLARGVKGPAPSEAGRQGPLLAGGQPQVGGHPKVTDLGVAHRPRDEADLAVVPPPCPPTDALLDSAPVQFELTPTSQRLLEEAHFLPPGVEEGVLSRLSLDLGQEIGREGGLSSLLLELFSGGPPRLRQQPDCEGGVGVVAALAAAVVLGEPEVRPVRLARTAQVLPHMEPRFHVRLVPPRGPNPHLRRLGEGQENLLRGELLSFLGEDAPPLEEGVGPRPKIPLSFVAGGDSDRDLHDSAGRPRGGHLGHLAVDLGQMAEIYLRPGDDVASPPPEHELGSHLAGGGEAGDGGGGGVADGSHIGLPFWGIYPWIEIRNSSLTSFGQIWITFQPESDFDSKLSGGRISTKSD